MSRKRAKILVFSAIVLTLLDGLFKYLALTRLSTGGRLNFLVDFSLHQNPGIAFDIPIPLSIVITISLFAIGALIFAIKNPWKNNTGLQVASILIISGALNNMLDRIINGFTTDYIILFRTSAINIADILIISGVILILWYNRNRDGNSN